MITKNQQRISGCINLKYTAGVAACLKALTGNDYKNLCRWWEYFQNKYTKSYGIRQCAKHMKAYYNFAVRVALDYPVMDIEPLPFTRVNCRGIPKFLVPFEKGLRSSIIERRAMLSILNCHEALTTNPIVDLSTITDSSPMPSGTRESFKEVWENTNLLKPLLKGSLFVEDIIGPDRMYKSSNSGPNGKAVLTAHYDAVALVNDPTLYRHVIALLNFDFASVTKGYKDKKYPALSGPLKSARNLLKNKMFSKMLTKPAKHVISAPPGDFYEYIHGNREDNRAADIITKLGFGSGHLKKNKEFFCGFTTSVIRAIGDKSCKSRVVAIADYWSQLALLPIHNLFFEYLRNIGECDGTYSHDRAAQRVAEWLSNDVAVWSFDLTAATDLFPRILSKDLMSVIDPEMAELWYNVISDRVFNVGGKRRHTVQYGRGTPMGLLSSWPVFALTHHAVVRTCAYFTGKKGFTNYVIIGDDVVIADYDVAVKYRTVMTAGLGCKISEGKSIVSSHGYYRGEIAKRIFLGKYELSPLTPGSIKEVRDPKGGEKGFKFKMKELGMLPFFLRKLHARQWFDQLERTGTPAQGMVMNFINKLYHKNHHRSIWTKFNNIVLSLLSVPGVLPASLMKSDDALIDKFQELFGDDYKQSLYIALMYYSNRNKSLSRSIEDTELAIKRFCYALDFWLADLSGFTIVAHPFIYLFMHELSRLRRTLSDINAMDVTTILTRGGLKNMDISVFTEAFISDEFKTREGDRSRLILRTLRWMEGKTFPAKEALQASHQMLGVLELDHTVKKNILEYDYIAPVLQVPTATTAGDQPWSS